MKLKEQLDTATADRKKSAAALRRALKFDEEVIANVSDGICILDAEGLVVFVNPAAERLLGWTAAELCGKSMHEVSHSKHRDGSPFPAAACAQTGVRQPGKQVTKMQDVFIRKDGTFFDVRLSSSQVLERGKVIGMVVVFSEETDRQRAEAVEQDGQRKFRELAEAMSQLAWIARSDGFIMTELVLNVPRVGFFSTPAFFANWQTNASNAMRVTFDQIAIVALGAAVDGSDPTVPNSTAGLDAVHASNPDCASCHQTLDPSRSILAATWSWYYGTQTDPVWAKQKGLFAFQGVSKPVANVDDFAQTLAAHPLFAPAWAQKLMYAISSRQAETDDPEFQRIVAAFVSSGFSWDTLVLELATSPLATSASRTKTTTDLGTPVSLARRDHLCGALNARLGLQDVCGQNAAAQMQAKTAVPASLIAGLPSDAYGRGGPAPLLSTSPNLFFRAAVEAICADVAGLVVDPAKPLAGARVWSGKQPDAAIADFVKVMMGLIPSDPRSAQVTLLLKNHFVSATATGATPAVALRSTFTVACTAADSASAFGL